MKTPKKERKEKTLYSLVGVIAIILISALIVRGLWNGVISEFEVFDLKNMTYGQSVVRMFIAFIIFRIGEELILTK